MNITETNQRIIRSIASGLTIFLILYPDWLVGRSIDFQEFFGAMVASAIVFFAVDFVMRKFGERKNSDGNSLLSASDLQYLKKSINDYVELLKNLNADEFAVAVAQATSFANRNAKALLIDLYDPWSVLILYPDFVSQLQSEVQVHDRNHEPDKATPLVIWIYSFMAVSVPALRPSGRALWAELARAFPYVEQTAATLLHVGINLDIHDYERIPKGLEKNAN